MNRNITALLIGIAFLVSGCSRSPETPQEAPLGTVARVISGEAPDDSELTGAGAIGSGGSADTAARPMPADQIRSAMDDMEYFVGAISSLEDAIAQYQSKENDASGIESQKDEDSDSSKDDDKDDKDADAAADTSEESSEQDVADKKKSSKEETGSKEITEAQGKIQSRISVRTTAIESFDQEIKANEHIEDKDKTEVTGSIALKKDELAKKKDAVTSAKNLSELIEIDKNISEMKIFMRELSKQKELSVIYVGKKALNKKVTPALLDAEKAITENKRKNLPTSEQEALLASARQFLIDVNDNLDAATSELEGISPAQTESASLEQLNKARDYLKKVSESFTSAKEPLESLSSK